MQETRRNLAEAMLSSVEISLASLSQEKLPG